MIEILMDPGAEYSYIQQNIITKLLLKRKKLKIWPPGWLQLKDKN